MEGQGQRGDQWSVKLVFCHYYSLEYIFTVCKLLATTPWDLSNDTIFWETYPVKFRVLALSCTMQTSLSPANTSLLELLLLKIAK